MRLRPSARLPPLTVVPGLLEVVAALRQRGMLIGATTGCFTEATQLVLTMATKQNFVPDFAKGADDVPTGRPAPWMIFRIMEKLDVFPASTVVKIGDTISDIEEGLNAAAWSLGVTESSSECGCSESEYRALSENDRKVRLAPARHKFLQAGAHAVIDTLAELPALLDKLEARLSRGEKP